jgi:hypothetical protein
VPDAENFGASTSWSLGCVQAYSRIALPSLTFVDLKIKIYASFSRKSVMKFKNKVKSCFSVKPVTVFNIKLHDS